MQDNPKQIEQDRRIFRDAAKEVQQGKQALQNGQTAFGAEKAAQVASESNRLIARTRSHARSGRAWTYWETGCSALAARWRPPRS